MLELISTIKRSKFQSFCWSREDVPSLTDICEGRFPEGAKGRDRIRGEMQMLRREREELEGDGVKGRK